MGRRLNLLAVFQLELNRLAHRTSATLELNWTLENR